MTIRTYLHALASQQGSVQVPHGGNGYVTARQSMRYDECNVSYVFHNVWLLGMVLRQPGTHRGNQLPLSKFARSCLESVQMDMPGRHRQIDVSA